MTINKLSFPLIVLIAVLLMGFGGENDFSQQQLNLISKNCGLSNSLLKLEGSHQVSFQPNLKEEHESIVCALEELQKIDGISVGFVGNEVNQADDSGNLNTEGDKGY